MDYYPPQAHRPRRREMSVRGYASSRRMPPILPLPYSITSGFGPKVRFAPKRTQGPLLDVQSPDEGQIFKISGSFCFRKYVTCLCRVSVNPVRALSDTGTDRQNFPFSIKTMSIVMNLWMLWELNIMVFFFSNCMVRNSRVVPNKWKSNHGLYLCARPHNLRES